LRNLLHSRQGDGHLGGGCGIEPFKPLGESFVSAFVNVAPDLDHPKPMVTLLLPPVKRHDLRIYGWMGRTDAAARGTRDAYGATKHQKLSDATEAPHKVRERGADAAKIELQCLPSLQPS
jgi:hypothetical protein